MLIPDNDCLLYTSVQSLTILPAQNRAILQLNPFDLYTVISLLHLYGVSLSRGFRTQYLVNLFTFYCAFGF